MSQRASGLKNLPMRLSIVLSVSELLNCFAGKVNNFFLKCNSDCLKPYDDFLRDYSKEVLYHEVLFTVVLEHLSSFAFLMSEAL